MKHRFLILSLFITAAVFFIYLFTVDHKINYIALGDSLAAGQNPYGEISYGYSDLVANYLRRNKLLDFYTKDFAESGDKIEDLKKKLENNQMITVDGKDYHIKTALREADLVTISIGANDFIKHFSLTNLNFDQLTSEKLKQYVDEVLDQLDPLFQELKKYAKKKVLVIGYYNPLPRITEHYTSLMKELFDYADQGYFDICHKYDFQYIPLYQKFKGHNDYLPNPIDIHPNLDGYQIIANQIIDYLEKKVF